MNTSDFSSNRDSGKHNECIEAIVELILDRVHRGESADMERFNREHPELQPELSARLKTLQYVLDMGRDSQGNHS